MLRAFRKSDAALVPLIFAFHSRLDLSFFLPAFFSSCLLSFLHAFLSRNMQLYTLISPDQRVSLAVYAADELERFPVYPLHLLASNLQG